MFNTQLRFGVHPDWTADLCSVVISFVATLLYRRGFAFFFQLMPLNFYPKNHSKVNLNTDFDMLFPSLDQIINKDVLKKKCAAQKGSFSSSNKLLLLLWSISRTILIKKIQYLDSN